VSSGDTSAGKGQADETGRLLAGRYRIVAQLGRGGMGVVWRAVDEVLGREVAVKELRTYTDADGPELADLRLRMQREARAAARVRHPGVVAVHDVAEVDGRPLIVMELVDGPSLDDVLRERGTLDAREAAEMGAKVMDALAAAHRAGVLHRDVKPGNILLDRSGRVVLTDFGIATMEDPGDGSATHLTRSGELVGSLDYLAPERAQGADPGPASDIWALGATLYAAVEGSSPFRRTSTYSTLAAIVTEPLPQPLRAGALAPVLRRLMDKRPEARPEAEQARELLQAVVNRGGTDTPTTTLRGASAPVREVTERSVPTVPPGFGPAEPVAPAGQGFGPPKGAAHGAQGVGAPGAGAPDQAGPADRTSDSGDQAGRAAHGFGSSEPPGEAGQGTGSPGQVGQGVPGFGSSGQAGHGAEGFGSAGQARQGSGSPGQVGQGVPGFGSSGQAGHGAEGFGSAGQARQGSGSAGQVGQGVPGFGSSGQAGHGAEGFGSAGQARQGSGSAGQVGQGVPGFGSSGQAGHGAEGFGSSEQAGQPGQGSGSVSQAGHGVPGFGSSEPAGRGAEGFGSAEARQAAHGFGSAEHAATAAPGFGPPPAVGTGPDSAATGPIPAPTNPRRKGRALLAAAAVTLVLAAAGVTVARMNNSGDAEANARPASSSTSAEASSSASGRTDADRSDDPKPTQQGDEKTPTAPQKTPRGQGASTPAGKASPSAPANSSGGGTTGGTSGGGSGDGGTTTGGGGGGETSEAPACQSIGGGKYNCQVWQTAKSYTASGTEVGVLGKGTNYFFCQQNLGRRETSGQWTNVWWAKTDDDRGNTNVYISDVYIQGGDNDEPVPGLPVC